MDVVTIPKKLAQRGKLVLISQDEYDRLVHLQRRIPVVKPTPEELRVIRRGEREIRASKYIEWEQLKKKLKLSRQRKTQQPGGPTKPTRFWRANPKRSAEVSVMPLTERKRWKKPAQVNDEEAWFWTPEWQKREREADEDIRRGRVSPAFSSAEELIADLRRSAERWRKKRSP